MVLCYESRSLARSLGPGPAVGEKGKKRGEIGKISTSGGKKFAFRIFFPHTGVFLFFFSQCGAWSQAILRVVVNEYVCVSLHTDRLVYFELNV